MTVRELIECLNVTYCSWVGFQYMHIADQKMREWIQQRIEKCDEHAAPPRDIQLRILTRLTDAVIFEEFVRKKYLGTQTFSLEGAETLIPLLDLALEAAARDGIGEVVMAMAHRGRLNVLANIVGKQPAEIFREFEDPYFERWRGPRRCEISSGRQWRLAGRQRFATCISHSASTRAIWSA